MIIIKCNSNSSIIQYILILAFIVMEIHCQISLMNYYQSQQTLKHIIRGVKQSKIQQIDDKHQQKCIKSNKCCFCEKQFKNFTYLELHMVLHHPLKKQQPQDYMLMQIFDKRVNNEYRFQACLKYFKFIKLDKLFINQIQAENESNMKNKKMGQKIKQQNQNFNVSQRLTPSQMVDICTIAAYGSYQRPIWILWTKGTLIFVAVITFLVYYSNLFDQIKDYYFPKKKTQKRNFKSTPPLISEESDQQN